MGEIADDLIDRMMDGDDDMYYPHRSYLPRVRHAAKPKKKVKEYPEKTFDMGFFPTNIPKPRTVVEEPKEQAPDLWQAASDEEAPF